MSSNGSYFSVGTASSGGTITTATTTGKIVTTLHNYDDSYSICPDFENKVVKDRLSEIIKDEVTKILLEDPDSEIMEIAENYLVGCVEDAMNAPDKNSVIKKYLEKIRTDLTKTIDEKCSNLDGVIGKYLRDNNYMDYPSMNSYVQYEIDNNPTNKIKKLQDRIDVLSKIVSDLCERLNYYTNYDSSDYGQYSNGYEKTFMSQTGRG